VSKVLHGIEVAEMLAARSAAVVDDIAAAVQKRFRERTSVDVDLASLRGSVQDNVSVLLHLLANPNEAETALPPHRTISMTQSLARGGIPLYDVIDAYLLAERTWIRACIEELTDQANDVPSAFALILQLLDMDRLFVEHNLRLLAEEYEHERVRWAEHGETLCAAAIQRLLSGDHTDIDGAEVSLGYRLSRTHLAAILWTPSDGGPMRFSEMIAALGKAVGAVGPPLVSSSDISVRWVWIPVTADALDSAAVRDEMGRIDADLCIALGEPASGPDGFARSHRQAAAAFAVGKHAVPQKGHALVVPYHEVGAIAFLAADLERAEDWVTQTLGRLGVDAPRENELRATVEAYLGSGRSVSSAARVLQCHRNTVHYRLSVADELLGHPVVDNPSNLQLALAAARWLGSSVLGGRTAQPTQG
jgi:DNA-binding PucR family transcriptional regulator